jgi:hypothetical protein
MAISEIIILVQIFQLFLKNKDKLINFNLFLKRIQVILINSHKQNNTI